MSPEQALGKPLDERTDLFPFGTVLYEMAAGVAPFRGGTTGTLFLSVVQEPPAPVVSFRPDLPERLQQIINKCLERPEQERSIATRCTLNDIWLRSWKATVAG